MGDERQRVTPRVHRSASTFSALHAGRLAQSKSTGFERVAADSGPRFADLLTSLQSQHKKYNNMDFQSLFSILIPRNPRRNINDAYEVDVDAIGLACTLLIS